MQWHFHYSFPTEDLNTLTLASPLAWNSVSHGYQNNRAVHLVKIFTAADKPMLHTTEMLAMQLRNHSSSGAVGGRSILVVYGARTTVVCSLHHHVRARLLPMTQHHDTQHTSLVTRYSQHDFCAHPHSLRAAKLHIPSLHSGSSLSASFV